MKGHISGKGRVLVSFLSMKKTNVYGDVLTLTQYPLDHKLLITKIRKLKLPLVVCRSKSGGAHCFLFATDWIEAKEMQETLQQVSAALGYGNSEIFPKQIKQT